MTATYATAIERLNDDQRAAVESSASTVVLAGPGSGKTDTIALKVARLLRQEVAPPRGVACLTYSNDAVREFSDRLRGFGVRSEHRLFLGTTHSFCMQRILRPFAALCGRPALARPRLLSSAEQLAARQRALDDVGVADDARYFDATLTSVRRAIACNEDLAPFDDRHVEVAYVYDELLTAEDAVDFEAMTLNALKLLDDHPDVGALVGARYPWIAVDEYQDLGGPLHHLVLRLRGHGVHVVAVGDPDQCIFGFTGASPEYLRQLAAHDDFEVITLRFNYRSGADLVAAAQASLGEVRPYEADPKRKDRGTINVAAVDGGLKGQARHVVSELVPNLLTAGVLPEQIAILYKQRGPVLDSIVDEIERSDVDFLIERDLRFPAGPTVRWLQQCATRAVSPDAADCLSDLLAGFPGRWAPGQPAHAELEIRLRLLDALGPADPDTPLHEWIAQVERDLALVEQLGGGTADSDAVEALRNLARPVDPPVHLIDFARGVSLEGRVVVTTCHAAKGRQFDAVVMPGLQRTLFPGERYVGGQYVATDLVADRRLFYVGITRARNDVYLISSPRFTNQWGYDVPGRSQFLDELEARLVLGT